ncbi:carbon-nitrogen hydrolase family protein [Beggiatoa leptomitoformis]|uniref:Carbon-nitrogen hydrolase family protein n=1 Tax=Beggiatoa leptomitoformis TaxID=288004 RepID=A0A2N9YFC4_9GAMM|nr:carbon-nitrogen hydrolase family protein [Beggiatoa leptomitoformis]ALG68468.1 carbon-nitrogen hydrolase family protein [Beggiatoa leptomitoformis]AUI69198.1 carbon-nitrogen hydrolase family protein [Beggiatoa leptomitoformis]
MTRIAALQMISTTDVNTNLQEAARLIAQAADQGAELVSLPENFALMGQHDTDKVKIRESFGQGHIQDFLATQATKYGVWLIGGTIPLVADAPDKVRAACLVLNNSGQCVARYDKMHLFDVMVSPEESYCESRTIEAGHNTNVVDTPFGRIGLAICYDVRFPELFRCLTAQGATIISLPSAFTAMTGKAHWEILVRARAIENLSYVLAPNQGGVHANGRETYGDSLIVDPWGNILSRLGQGAGIIYADLDPTYLQTIRRNFPTLDHKRIACQQP